MQFIWLVSYDYDFRSWGDLDLEAYVCIFENNCILYIYDVKSLETLHIFNVFENVLFFQKK